MRRLRRRRSVLVVCHWKQIDAILAIVDTEIGQKYFNREMQRPSRRVAVTDSHALGAADGAASSCFSGAATAGSIVLGGICQDGQLVFDVHDWDP